ncbi:sulfite exporter TauE/SafE family protein [Geoglobus acetivorans]|uniref:Probable membrane transporter protein n=1 Tax=Geoglobus acetivorans TaxID=565033 RepID=A0A0A7GGR0_GEOAI|nr:protein of unknown function DUF81 [Geoglobus acetivorans]
MLEIVGFAVGLLVGLTGIGGGALMTPLLILFGISPKIAVGTDLAYAFSVKSFSAAVHKRGDNFDFRLFRFTAVPGVFGIIAGHIFFTRGLIDEGMITITLAAVLLVSSILMLYTSKTSRIKTECFICDKYCESFHDNSMKVYFLIPVGFLVGLLVQITSVGGGTLLTFAVLNLTNLKPNRVVGTDLATSTLFSAVALISHGSLGNVDLGLATQLIPAGLVGSLLGYYLSKRCSPGFLRMAITASIGFASLVIIASKI